jgi:simple sugar transport system ATP-binding protein
MQMTHLQVLGVTKTFATFKALDDVSLSAAKGEIRALLGENGAGKTTLMNVLYGLYKPDAGQICIDGAPIFMSSPRDAIRHRIGMIHQHFHLASALSVVENVVLGLGGFRTDLELHAKKIAALSEEYGFDIDPHAPIWKLPIGMRQRVEILKALYRNAEILVLDEPTSVLAPDEIAGFLRGLKKLRAAGHTILFVTHKLEEVMEVSDSVTVMRRGRVVETIAARDTSPAHLSRVMVGREVDAVHRGGRPTPKTDIRLQLKSIVAHNDRGALALKSVDLSLHAGEVLGITGVDGNGQRELAETIVGLRPVLSGDIVVDGKSIKGLTVRDRIVDTRIGFVPEDRHETGLVLDYPVATNMALRDFDRSPVSRMGIIDDRVIQERASDLVERYDIRLAHRNQHARMLSGGNQQKIIIAREVHAGPRILVVMQATKGLDVGAIAFIQRKILEERDRGVAVLYISTELEHVMEVADRIGVLCAGQLSPILQPEQATDERIGLYMAGVQEEVA